MSLGRKIRLCRQQLGLSQQQLAGREMTRAFISLVESGKSVPSPKNLRVIARRLGKPVEYFLTDSDPAADKAEALALLSRAEQAMQHGDQEQLEVAAEQLKVAVERCAGLDDRAMEAQARLLLARCLYRLRRLDESISACEYAIGLFHAVSDPIGAARARQQLADSAFLSGDFLRAAGAYEQALLHVQGLKTMREFRVRVSTLLGSTYYRLGQKEDAAAHFRAALDECSAGDEPQLYGDAAMGLGCVLLRTRDLDGAQHWTEQAVAAFERGQSPSLVSARHNLGIIQFERGNWETAYSIFQQCLQIYREKGDYVRQASILEEMARYWVARGDHVEAERLCWDALDLLDVKDNPVLQARLYRMLGRIAEQTGPVRLARTYYRLSLHLFRHLKASAEVDETAACLATLENGGAGSPAVAGRSGARAWTRP